VYCPGTNWLRVAGADPLLDHTTTGPLTTALSETVTTLPEAEQVTRSCTPGVALKADANHAAMATASSKALCGTA
jgi:hypothetical protein